VLMSEGVGFVAICSNDAASYPEDSFESMKHFAKVHGFPFPYLHDETQTVARALWGGVYARNLFGRHRLCGRPEHVPGMKEFPTCLVATGRLRSLAPFADQGYPCSAMKLWPGGGIPEARKSRTVFVGDQMTHGDQKGFGMTQHGRSGHATRSPRFRFLQKLEAKKNDRKDRSRIKDPKQSVEELFHPGKQHET
jgi:hypothetical protein